MRKCNNKRRLKSRPLLDNPIAFAIEGVTLARCYGDGSKWRRTMLRNREALDDLMRGGQCGTQVLDEFIEALNMTEALARIGHGAQYMAEIRAGLDAMFDASRRFAKQQSFAFLNGELEAVRTALEVHEAQMEIATVAEIEKARLIVVDEIASRRARVPDDNV